MSQEQQDRKQLPPNLTPVRILSVVANEIRVDALFAIARGRKNVSQIAMELGLYPSTVSRALRELRKVGLVEVEVVNKQHVYRVSKAVWIDGSTLVVNTATGRVTIDSRQRSDHVESTAIRGDISVANLNKLLANETRLDILGAIATGISSPARIAKELHLDPSNVSRRLRELRKHDLIRHEVVGKQHLYRLSEVVTASLDGTVVHFAVKSGRQRLSFTTTLKQHSGDVGASVEQGELAGPISVYIDPTAYSPEEAGELLSIISDVYESIAGDRLVIDGTGQAYAAVGEPVLPGGGT